MQSGDWDRPEGHTVSVVYGTPSLLPPCQQHPSPTPFQGTYEQFAALTETDIYQRQRCQKGGLSDTVTGWGTTELAAFQPTGGRNPHGGWVVLQPRHS